MWLWIPAFAGMTAATIVRVPRPVCGERDRMRGSTNVCRLVPPLISDRLYRRRTKVTRYSARDVSLRGNFYLAPIGRFLDEYGVPSARYVDDIYIFLKNVDSSDHLLRELIPALRSYDLVINEAKASVMPKAALVTEEPDLETLFAAAIAEISSQIEDDEFDVDYGFQSDWEENETSDMRRMMISN